MPQQWQHSKCSHGYAITVLHRSSCVAPVIKNDRGWTTFVLAMVLVYIFPLLLPQPDVVCSPLYSPIIMCPPQWWWQSWMFPPTPGCVILASITDSCRCCTYSVPLGWLLLVLHGSDTTIAGTITKMGGGAIPVQWPHKSQLELVLQGGRISHPLLQHLKGRQSLMSGMDNISLPLSWSAASNNLLVTVDRDGHWTSLQHCPWHHCPSTTLLLYPSALPSPYLPLVSCAFCDLFLSTATLLLRVQQWH